MAISDYSTTRDSNASIAPGDLRSNDYRRDQQIINAIRQLMADLAAISAAAASFDRLRVSNNTDISSLTQTDQPFQVGTYDNINMMIDGNEIQARQNGAAATLNLNLLGGFIRIGSAGLLLDSFISFPATQVPSSDPNTLDDYEEGTWTPAITFATPGDVSVSGTLGGSYVKIGKTVTVWLIISTSTFTHTTAAGEFRVSGLPFTAASSSRISGSVELQGFNWPGGATQVTAAIPASTSYIRMIATGSGLSRVALTAADHPSGTNAVVITTISYEVA